MHILDIVPTWDRSHTAHETNHIEYHKHQETLSIRSSYSETISKKTAPPNRLIRLNNENQHAEEINLCDSIYLGLTDSSNMKDKKHIETRTQ